MKRVGVFVIGIILTTGLGCQTFRLSKEDFEKQQKGEMVDREVGEAVGLAGAVGYYGTVIGEVVARALGK